MKILFVCPVLTGGGAEKVCAEVASALAQRGHEVVILTHLEKPVTYEPDGRVKLVGFSQSKGKLQRKAQNIKIMAGLLKAADVAVSIMQWRFIAMKVISLFTGRCPIVSSIHSAFEHPKGYPMTLQDRFNKFWLNYLADYITILTQADQKVIGNRFKKIAVIPNPNSFPCVTNVPQKEKTVLAIGRIDVWQYKGFDILIDAWKRVEEAAPEWKLKIIGTAAVKENERILHDMTSGLKRVEFAPYRKEIKEEYAKAAIFVLSSRYEGFGNVVIEAMSQGCACIACDYKGRQGEIIEDAKTGLLCDTENPAALAQKIKLLIEDELLRHKLALGAIGAAGRFAPNVIACKWEAVLSAAVSQK